MAFPRRKRQYLEIVVARHLKFAEMGNRGLGHHMMTGTTARNYTNMIGEFDLHVQCVVEEYDGFTYEQFMAIYERRVEYHRIESQRASEQGMAYLCDFELKSHKTKPLYRNELVNGVLRKRYLKALNERGLYNYETDDPLQASPLNVPVLSDTELRALEAYLLDIAEHEAYSEALRQVHHYLKGHDVFEVRPTKRVATVSELANLLLQQHPDKVRRELIDIGVTQYEVTSMPHYRKNKRAFRKALYASFVRRKKK